jgi:hypothetical protein
MTPAGVLVLILILTFIGLTVRNFVGAPSRFGVVSGRIAMLGFAALGAFFFWMARDMRASRGPAYVELPVDPPGRHEVTIRRLGRSPGFGLQLVQKSDRTQPAPFTMDKVRACGWEVPGQSVHLHDAACECTMKDDLMDFRSEAGSVQLRYQVTEATKPLLAQVVLQVNPPWGYRGVTAGLASAAQGFMIGSLMGLLAAAGSVTFQRRKLSRPASSPPPVS